VERSERIASCCGRVRWLPRSLHYVADTPYYGVEEKTGHSGRDDTFKKGRAGGRVAGAGRRDGRQLR